MSDTTTPTETDVGVVIEVEVKGRKKDVHHGPENADVDIEDGVLYVHTPEHTSVYAAGEWSSVHTTAGDGTQVQREIVAELTRLVDVSEVVEQTLSGSDTRYVSAGWLRDYVARRSAELLP